MHTVYAIFNSAASRVYVGQTIDLVKRLKEHNNRTFKGYTSRFLGEWQLIYEESVATRPEAIARERQLKSYLGREFIKSHIPT